MKYSKREQCRHLNLVRHLMAGQTNASSRKVCHLLDERGRHLNRGYVLKLMRHASGDLHAERMDELYGIVGFAERRTDFEEFIDEIERRFRVLKQRFRREFKYVEKTSK